MTPNTFVFSAKVRLEKALYMSRLLPVAAVWLFNQDQGIAPMGNNRIGMQALSKSQFSEGEIKYLGDLGWEFMPYAPEEWGWMKFDQLGNKIAAQGDEVWCEDIQKMSYERNMVDG